MITVTELNSTPIKNDPFRFVTEASTVGIRAGEWPCIINTTLGNKMSLVRGDRLVDGGYVYDQVAGCIRVNIYND